MILCWNGAVNRRGIVSTIRAILTDPVYSAGERKQLKADEPLALGGHGALDQLEVVEGDAGAHGDAFEGVVGHVAGDADLLGDQAVEARDLA